MKYGKLSRSPFHAALLALCMPGLGQVYNGDLIKGACFLFFSAAAPVMLMKMMNFLPERMMIIVFVGAFLASLAIYVGAIVDAVRTCRQNADTSIRKRYNTGIFYLAVFVAGAMSIGITENYLRTQIVTAYKIVTNSMAPAVLQGDYVLTDRQVYSNGPVHDGDIIIHVFPDDRSKVFIRQIVALPGESVSYENGTVMTAPHGMVLVKGATADGKDSRDYGPVDMRDIVGKVRQIYFSKGSDGIRWERIGMLIGTDSNQK